MSVVKINGQGYEVLLIGDKAIAAWEQHDAGQGGPFDGDSSSKRQSLIARWEHEIEEWKKISENAGPLEKAGVQVIIASMQSLIDDIRSLEN